jgi:hypothetical protein
MDRIPFVQAESAVAYSVHLCDLSRHCVPNANNKFGFAYFRHQPSPKNQNTNFQYVVGSSQALECSKYTGRPVKGSFGQASSRPLVCVTASTDYHTV